MADTTALKNLVSRIATLPSAEREALRRQARDNARYDRDMATYSARNGSHSPGPQSSLIAEWDACADDWSLTMDVAAILCGFDDNHLLAQRQGRTSSNPERQAILAEAGRVRLGEIAE